MRLRFFAAITCVLTSCAVGLPAWGQAMPTASRGFGISAFGGLTGTYTGLDGGKNLGITAGVDIGFRSFFRFRPYLEGRGTYPLDNGHIDGQRSVLAGARVERIVRPRLRVYGDALIGRGEIDYQSGGYPSPLGGVQYLRSTSTIVSSGGGVEYQLTHHVSVLADAQFQHWNTPATPSGSLWSKPLTVGVRYNFNFNRHDYPVAPH